LGNSKARIIPIHPVVLLTAIFGNKRDFIDLGKEMTEET
jgi:hypothetical protein